MKTEEILNLDCTKNENVEKLNKVLWKVKPIAKLLQKNNYTKSDIIPLELLEQAMHGIMLRYNYRTQGIQTYYEEKDGKQTFVFYDVRVLKVRDTRDWIGTVYGKTLWECTAKTIIKVYGDIRKEQESK